MEDKCQKQAEYLFTALCKSEEEVGEAKKLMREFDFMLSTALDALRNIKGATPQDESRKQVVRERAEVIVEQCRKYLADHSDPL